MAAVGGGVPDRALAQSSSAEGRMVGAREDMEIDESRDAGSFVNDPLALAPLRTKPPPMVPVIPETEVVMAAVGDVIPHEAVQIQASRHALGFRSLWREVEVLLHRADLAFANLETPVAADVLADGSAAVVPGVWYDGKVYSGYPTFNAPDLLARQLKEAGVTVVLTANNHCLDRGPLGIDRTIDALNDIGLLHTGTRRRNAAADQPWHVVTAVRGMRIAWLGCTYGSNGFADQHGQSLRCYQNQAAIMDMIRDLRRQGEVDAVIVTPHFGIEYDEQPTPAQRQFARRAIEAGALAVIGSHPHVVQPWEWWPAGDGRQGFILYSLGNFISNQDTVPTRSSLVLYLGLARAVADGSVVVSGVRYVPIQSIRASADQTGEIKVEMASADGADPAGWNYVVGRFGPAFVHAPTLPLTTLAEAGARATILQRVGRLMRGVGGQEDDPDSGTPAEAAPAADEGPVLMVAGNDRRLGEGLAGPVEGGATALEGAVGPNRRRDTVVVPPEGPVAEAMAPAPPADEGACGPAERAGNRPAEGGVSNRPLPVPGAKAG
jgi:poly-gamma-glutamate synthesis protein (capsule biosynthesis protein)